MDKIIETFKAHGYEVLTQDNKQNSQSEKVVNVDISEKFEENHNRKVNNNIKRGSNDVDDMTSSNKVNHNDDKQSNQTKDDNISNKEEEEEKEDK